MKRLVATLIVSLALFGCGGTGAPVDVPVGAGVRTVGPDAAKDLIASGDVVVIDVRTAQEYAERHVEGAINIDVSGANFTDRIERLDAGDSYVVYCHSGRRSAIAADQMEQAGFTDVADAGGLDGLIAAGVATR